MLSQKDQRIEKLAGKGLPCPSIARKIGQPGDLARVHAALAKLSLHCTCDKG